MTDTHEPSSWPCTGTPPLTQALLRATPEDFVVDEQMDIALSGAGEHLWLQIRKRGFNTDLVARQLARAAGIAARNVSYAGMKDRHAVTTQWFSVHLPGREAPSLAEGLPAGVEILATQRHARKLQRGALTGNRFSIVLRDCRGDTQRTLQRVADIARAGVPNYFGEQRFGRERANVDRAMRMFAGERVPDHHQRGLYLSAARSWLFNEVLARRVADGSWNQGLDGDVFILHGSNSFFMPDAIDEVIHRRLAEGDIHPSGPLWGESELPSRGAVLALETEIGQRSPALVDGLARARLRQERRALRLLVPDFTAQWIDDTTLQLQFSLPAGTYATTVLREIAAYSDSTSTKTPETDRSEPPEAT